MNGIPNSQKGFTIVELLVVMSIFSILTSVAAVSMNIKNNFDASFDTVRKSDLNMLRKSFALYYTDHRCYPTTAQWDALVCGTSVSDDFKPYMSKVPCDPETKQKYYYEPLDKTCRVCSGVCGTCVGLRILTQLKYQKDPNGTLAGCDPTLGCGVNAPDGTPYNYGVALNPSQCTIQPPLPTHTPTNAPTATNTPTTTPTRTPTPSRTPTPTPLAVTCTGQCLGDNPGTKYPAGLACIGMDGLCYLCGATGNWSISQSACGSITPTPTPVPSTPTPTPTPIVGQTTFTKRVIVIGYNPAQNGTTVADTYFKSAMGNKTATQLEDDTFAGVRQAFLTLSNNTIQYTIVKKIQISTFPVYPDGFSYTLDSYKKCVWGTPGFDAASCETRKWQFNYTKWLSDNGICAQMQANNADEVWMLSPPYIMAYENFMFGPNYGFDVNGPSYTDTTCTKHYIAVNGTYDRSDLLLHDYGHRVEATMRFIIGGWKDADKTNYWERFAFLSEYSGGLPTTNVCGNTHYPFNTTAAYDTGNTATKTNICPDWNNFPNFIGTTKTGNCALWGCTDMGWQMYWFSMLPHNTGSVTMTSRSGRIFQFSRNWWNYILSPDDAISIRNAAF